MFPKGVDEMKIENILHIVKNNVQELYLNLCVRKSLGYTKEHPNCLPIYYKKFPKKILGAFSKSKKKQQPEKKKTHLGKSNIWKQTKMRRYWKTE